MCSTNATNAAPPENPQNFDGGLPIPEDLKKIHGLIGSITGFLLVFRTNLAYDRYYEGRKLVGGILNSTREMISAAYTFLPRDDLNERDLEKYNWLKEHVRRKSLVLWTVIRHALRESTSSGGDAIGFQAGCGLDDPQYKDNFMDYWHLDPCKPEIAWLIDAKEKKVS